MATRVVRAWWTLGLLAGSLIWAGGVGVANDQQTPTGSIRQAQVAGDFYPAEPGVLRGLVSRLLEAASPAALPNKPRILISPHAGYPYSGPVAAVTFRQIRGAHYDGVVVIGFTHRSSFPVASVDTVEAYQTPLGTIPVDQEAVKFLLAPNSRLHHETDAHTSGEHSLEVMLPFLQVALGEFRLVPILMGTSELSVAQDLAEALAALNRRGDYLFVFSTDLSHYHPYDLASGFDEQTIGAILRETPQAVDRLFQQGAVEACGRGPIVTSLLLAAKLGYPTRTLLRYANSGDTTGDRSRVVGYGAIAMVDHPPVSAGRLSPEAGQALVKAARATLERELAGSKQSPISLEGYPELAKSTGLFVTLRKHGELRGCIGRIEGVGSLASVLPMVAMGAALRDHRFQPVTAEELKEIDVEVSVLTPPAKLEQLNDLVPGRDGVILESQDHSGVFLPKVWEETGWTRMEFLRELASQKAGLPPDAWKSATLSTFQDQVFSE